MKRTSFFTLLMVLISVTLSAASINIIPKPSKLVVGDGSYKLSKAILITANDKDALESAEFLKDIIEESSSIEVEVERTRKSGDITLKIDDKYSCTSGEGYSLSVTKKGVVVTSNTATGIFYGVQSLRQLLPASIESEDKLSINKKLTVPYVEITDEPRFGWRGYMKDVSRTFYSVDVVKKYLDVMALYKMNVFHLHLTDDQGWRIEIKKYPELTSELTTVFHESCNQPAERSGYYTQKDIKEIVKYAAERHITVVPEIDVPGHSWATLLVYPELGVNDNHKPFYVFPFLEAWGHWGNQFTPNSLDPTNEKVYEFLTDVFGEVAELFPSEYIHFGGDEVMHHFWTAEPHVQAFMKEKGFDNVNKLQSYFVERVAKIITDLGRKPLGWNDILSDSGLTKETAIMSWLGANAITQAANNGYKAVATPSYPMYFDITQECREDGTMTDLNYPQINSMEAVYNYNPTAGVDDDKKHLVLGVQANMWPAVPQEVKDINVQNFPRLLGVAEVGWSPETGKDYAEFSERLEENKRRLDYLKVDYFRSGGYISGRWETSDVTTDYHVKEWDMTHKVYASGRVIAAFFLTEGENFLEIDGVELLEDGEVISSDSHLGLANYERGIAKARTYFYNLEVEKYKKRATYTLRAKIKGQGGSDSAGNVTFNLSPYKPFTVVEAPGYRD